MLLGDGSHHSFASSRAPDSELACHYLEQSRELASVGLHSRSQKITDPLQRGLLGIFLPRIVLILTSVNRSRVPTHRHRDGVATAKNPTAQVNSVLDGNRY